MKKFTYYILIGFFALCLIGLAFYAATIVEANGTVREFVAQFGILGILIVAFISGLNILIPLHAATFTPIFTQAGFNLPTIIAAFTLGTLMADLVGYGIGVWGRHATKERHPRIHQKLITFNQKHGRLILPAIFLFAAFVPFPNEAMLIPLGLIGFRFYTLLPPLILGTMLNHTLYALGFMNIFEAFV